MLVSTLLFLLTDDFELALVPELFSVLFVEEDLEPSLVVSHQSDLGAKVSLLAQLASSIGQYFVSV